MNGFDVEEQRLGFEAEDPKGPKKNKGCLIASVIVIVLVAILIAVPVAMFLVRTSIQETNREKYGGHGFEYMHGTSSTDFTGYHVYDGEQLATLDGLEELRETCRNWMVQRLAILSIPLLRRLFTRISI